MAVALLILLVILGIGAALIIGGSLDESAMDGIATAALICATSIGAWISITGQMRARVLEGMVFGAGWFLVIFLMGILLFNGPSRGIGVTALLCLGIGAGVGIIKRSKNPVKKGRKSYKFKAFVHNAQ